MASPLAGRRPASPLAYYFLSHPNNPLSPPDRLLPRTAQGMVPWKAPGNPNRMRAAYWRRLERRWSFFGTWLRTPERGLTAPATWEPLLEEAWGETLWGARPPTPYEFARDFLPTGSDARVDAAIYRRVPMKLMAPLSAFAHGWPLQPDERDRAIEGLHRLKKLPMFLIWARNSELDALPMGSWDSPSLIQRYAWRAQLNDDPLSVGWRKYTKAVPKHTSLEQLERLPSRSARTKRSSRRPILRGWVDDTAKPG